LVKGVLIVKEPAGYRHGAVAARLAKVLMDYADAQELGQVVAAETGFTLATDPDTVRAPDAAFVRRERLPDPPPAGFARLAPDLVVEVLSPDDRPGEVLAKVADWLSAGTRLGWVVDPAGRRARVHRADCTGAYQRGRGFGHVIEVADRARGFAPHVHLFVAERPGQRLERARQAQVTQGTGAFPPHVRVRIVEQQPLDRWYRGPLVQVGQRAH